MVAYQPNKLKVAGSNPARPTNFCRHFERLMTVVKTTLLNKGAHGLLHNPRFLVLRSGKVFDVRIMIVQLLELNGEFEGQPS